MKLASESLPRASHTGPSTSITAPIAAHLAGGRMAPVGAETRLPAVRDEPAETARPTNAGSSVVSERRSAAARGLVQEPRHRYRDRRPANCLDQ
jgi:hypothetical protein